MEEDIKILEELQKYCSLRSLDIEENNSDKWVKFVVAIENLIKGYREKEESEAYLYDTYQDAGKKMFEYSEKCDELEAKIKEIRDKAEVMDYYTLPDVIEDLNKLLGEEGNENE